MDRVYSYYLKMGTSLESSPKAPSWVDIRALAIVVWRQGIRRNYPRRFWRYMIDMAATTRTCWGSSW